MSSTISFQYLTEEQFTADMFTYLRTQTAYATSSEAQKTALILGVITTNNNAWNDFETKLDNLILETISAIKFQFGIPNKTDIERTAGFIKHFGDILSKTLIFLPGV